MWHYDLANKYNTDSVFYFDKLLDSWTNKSVASYDFKEDENHLTFNMDLPGVKNVDLNIESSIGQIKIFGKQKGKDFVYKYTMPKTYDPSTGEAKLEDGVLTLKFGKFSNAKPQVHSIKIK